MGQGSVWTGAGVSTRMHTCTHTHAHVHSVRHMCACTPCPPRGSPGLQGPQHPPHSLSLPGSLTLPARPGTGREDAVTLPGRLPRESSVALCSWRRRAGAPCPAAAGGWGCQAAPPEVGSRSRSTHGPCPWSWGSSGVQGCGELTGLVAEVPFCKVGTRTHLRRQSECAGVGADCLDVLSDSESSAEQGLPPGCPAMRDPPTVAASVLGTAAAAGSRTPGLPGGRASCRAPLSARGTCHESRGPGCVFACLGR